MKRKALPFILFSFLPYVFAIAVVMWHVAGFALVYLALAELGHWLSVEPGHFATLWPPSGWSLAVLTHVPRQRWPWYLGAAVLANLASDVGLHERPLLMSGAFVIGNTLESVGGAWLLLRIYHPSFRFRNVPAVLWFTSVALFSPVLSATIGAVTTVGMFDTPLWPTWAVWWSSDVVGIFVVAPLSWALIDRVITAPRLSFFRWLEAVVLLVSVGVVTHLMFSTPLLAYGLFLLLPLWLWATLRFGILGATLAGFLTAVVAVRWTVLGYGPFAQLELEPVQQVVQLQLAISSQLLSVLILATSWTQRGTVTVALAESEAQFRRMVQHAPVGIAVADLDAHFLSVNPAFCKLLGYTEQELLSRTWMDLTHPDDLAATLQAKEQLLRSVLPSRLEKRYVKKNGKTVWVSLTITLVRDITGRPLHEIGLIEDITLRRQAEKALRTLNAELEHRVQKRTEELAWSEERYRTIFDTTAVAIWEEDYSHVSASLRAVQKHGVSDLCQYLCSNPQFVAQAVAGVRILDVNAAAMRLCDAPNKQALLGSLCTIFAPETYATFTEQLIAFAAGHSHFEAETIIHTLRGERRHVFTAVTFPTPGKPFDHVLVSRLDITSRVQAEQSLQRATADLHQVAYVSAHDLQEPVRQVGVYTQKLAKRLSAALDVENQEAVGFIVEGTKRMQAQFTDLMHYLEIEDPGLGITNTDCESLLRSTLEALHETIAANDATITYTPLPTLAANAKHLQLVFQELIDNAIKFRNNVPPRVHVWAVRENDAWRFAVRDNGIGIDPQYIDQLFGFFRKLQRSTEYPGTGMGLAICKKIIERHGGRIWVDSRSGEGATVHFTIHDYLSHHTPHGAQ